MSTDKSAKTILVIDDEKFVLKTTVQIIRNLGYDNVSSASSAEAALDFLDNSGQTVQLILTDLNMPGMDGIELLAEIEKRDFKGSVILVSGEDEKTLHMSAALARARRLTILGAVQKPLRPVVLENLLQMMKVVEPDVVSPKGNKRPKITPDMIADGLAGYEFEPWFQPKIDVLAREPVGVEALARWPNSARGPVFPDEFIPVAEQCGLIDELTYQIAEKAARFGKQWRDEGIDFQIAVNISMDSLYVQGFPDRLYQLIRGRDKRTDRYQLEVTESRLMEDLVAPLEALLRLRLKKLSLSIDDFGTGHSNLSELKNLPFDELKLDRSYVQVNNDSGRSQSILEASLLVARKMGMKTVAEGIETLEDWRRLAALGCDQIQGYFTAKPMPGSEISEWVNNWPSLRQTLFS